MVAIFRGVPAQLGSITLGEVVETTDIAIDSLEPYQQDRIADTIRVSSVDEAHQVVEGLQAGT